MADWWDDRRKRLTPQKAERLRQVADLWNRAHLTCQQTAEKIGCAPSTVCKDRKILMDIWRDVVTADINDLAARELAKLDKEEAELWLAWERSKQDRTRATQHEKRERVPHPGEAGAGEAVVERNTTNVTEGRIPEARYMELIIRVGERRSKILGIDKGIKLADLDFDFRDLVRAAAEEEDAIAEQAAAARELDGQ